MTESARFVRVLPGTRPHVPGPTPRPRARCPPRCDAADGSWKGPSMTRDLIVSSTPQETKVALLEDGVVSEIFIEREAHRGIVGNIYKGRVTRVLPGMQSAFVDLGLERDAFLHVADVFEELTRTSSPPRSSGGPRHRAATRPSRSSSQRGAGGARPGAQGAPGHEGRAHHLPRLPARPLPRLHAHGRARRRVPQDHGRRGAAAAQDRSSRRSGSERGGGGFIARTAGQGRSREDFERDGALPGADLGRGAGASPRASGRPRCSTASSSLVQRLLRDILSDDIASIRLDSEKEFRRTLDLVNQLQPELGPAGAPLQRPREHLRGARRSPPSSSGPCGPRSGFPRAATSSSTRPRPWSRSTSTPGASSGKKTLEDTLAQDEPRRGPGDRAPDPPARPGRHHRGRLHRHGGAQEPAEGDGRARAGAEEGPLAVEAPLRERVRPRDPDPQARAPVPRAHALPDLPLLHGQRDDQERRHRVLGDLRRGQEARCRRRAASVSSCASTPTWPAPWPGTRPRVLKELAGLVEHEVSVQGDPAPAPGAVRRGPAMSRP